MHYGIPNMKIDKRQVERRVKLLAEEGIEFRTNSHIGVNVAAGQLEKEYGAVALCVGATMPRKLQVPGGELKGVEFAMDYLTCNQKGLTLDSETETYFRSEGGEGQSLPDISAEGKNVVVIGGGDTGTDCIGTALRQYCKSLVNLELLDKRPLLRDEASNYWPLYPKVYKLDYGHEEAKAVFGDDPRKFSVKTVSLEGNERGEVVGVKTIMLEHKQKGNDVELVEVPGSEKVIPAELVLLAMGFTGPEETLVKEFNLDTDSRSNIAAEYGKYVTSKQNVFAAGDCRRGQSLVVWAIHEGREVAEAIEQYLVDESDESRGRNEERVEATA